MQEQMQWPMGWWYRLGSELPWMPQGQHYTQLPRFLRVFTTGVNPPPLLEAGALTVWQARNWNRAAMEALCSVPLAVVMGLVARVCRDVPCDPEYLPHGASPCGKLVPASRHRP